METCSLYVAGRASVHVDPIWPIGEKATGGDKGTLLAGAQAAAVAETEHHPSLETVGNRRQPLRFIRTDHQWKLLRRAQVIHLGGQVQAPATSPGTRSASQS
jgi:hypothetical protein